jgi:hypothetical protein
VPIASSDLPWMLSTPSGSAGSTVASTAADSLGGYMSTTPLTQATLDNLFADITGDQNAADAVSYACLFLANNNPTLVLQASVVWLYSETEGGANIAIALDNIGITEAGSTSPQATTITDSATAPAGVTAFSAPTTKDSSTLLIGDIGPGECVAVWVQRTATNSSAQMTDGVVLRVEGNTTA